MSRQKAKLLDFILQINMRISSVYIFFSNTIAVRPAQKVATGEQYFSREIHHLSTDRARKTSNES